MSNQPKPQAPLIPGKFSSRDPFIKKLLVLIGGTLVLIIIGVVIVNVLFGSKTNVGDLLAIGQTQNEIVRVSRSGQQSGSETIRGAAINTQLTVTSQQQQIINYLAKRNRKVGTKELAAKKNADTDKQLTAATAATTFDQTFTVIMRTQLIVYASQLRDAYNNTPSGSTIERNLLRNEYNQTVVLLKQWPQSQ